MLPESEIGDKIRQLRKKKGLTLGRLAEKCGVTKGYLSKVENSDKAPPVSTLINIAAGLDVGISEIFGEDQLAPSLTLIKKKNRPIMARDGTRFGYSYETLAHNYPRKHMEPYILTIPKDIEQHHFPNGRVTASFGVTEFNPSTDSQESLLERVDKAMYQAKSDGRNCVRQL